METGITTRDKIITASLRLFAKRGYDGVSMREIASQVGIKGASIYNHFKGKEDIFQAIFDEMSKRYGDTAQMMHIPMQDDEQAIKQYLGADEEALLQMAGNLFYYFTHDEFAVLFRHLLVSEQHKYEPAANMMKAYYLETPLIFQTDIFRGIQEQGSFSGCDADVLALHFYSPVYLLLNQFDTGRDYEECTEQLKRHVCWFCRIYS